MNNECKQTEKKEVVSFANQKGVCSFTDKPTGPNVVIPNTILGIRG